MSFVRKAMSVNLLAVLATTCSAAAAAAALQIYFAKTNTLKGVYPKMKMMSLMTDFHY